MENFKMVRFTDDDFVLDVRADVKNDTVWVSLNELCALFGKDKSVISRHIKNSLDEEFDNSVIAKFATTAGDGNKRIAATLFICFLEYYNILYKNEKRVLDNNTLVALTLLIAESNPKEKSILIDLVMNFLIDK